MKKYFVLLLLAFFPFANSDAQSRQEIDADDFSGISFGVAGKLYLEQADDYSVIIEGDADLLDDIRVFVRGDRLIIRNDTWLNFGNKKVTARVRMPVVESLSVSGSGELLATDAVNAAYLDVSVSGSGDINLDMLKADGIDCSISGSGNIELKGMAGEGDVSISGSGKYSGLDFAVGTMEVSISGSGRCKVNVEDSLEARVSGSGNVYYKGNPRIDARISGSGKVRKY
ncbi:MAG TPA: head GIN domain-containing protein [Bacteroidales bacterium]|nr:head GIN domain-containing protein [Bacteroidales bacterium]